VGPETSYICGRVHRNSASPSIDQEKKTPRLVPKTQSTSNISRAALPIKEKRLDQLRDGPARANESGLSVRLTNHYKRAEPGRSGDRGRGDEVEKEPTSCLFRGPPAAARPPLGPATSPRCSTCPSPSAMHTTVPRPGTVGREQRNLSSKVAHAAELSIFEAAQGRRASLHRRNRPRSPKEQPRKTCRSHAMISRRRVQGGGRHTQDARKGTCPECASAGRPQGTPNQHYIRVDTSKNSCSSLRGGGRSSYGDGLIRRAARPQGRFASRRRRTRNSVQRSLTANSRPGHPPTTSSSSA